MFIFMSKNVLSRLYTGKCFFLSMMATQPVGKEGHIRLWSTIWSKGKDSCPSWPLLVWGFGEML